ncbi:unnamed protein product [Didymodactylos carnosus]|uniref:Uncharacterized protein n=1 Tax=Didymodactylos carnosus TaxID=1234261 RepID=A0A814Y2T8_9BILA|nr:unnamed protein product [Didymodactylos carnosus]CAF1224041.1 unnamed protein product [Didymodactylos carnosus]CAF3840482.1 unnamed protein product [Didymodactylos carnosus]CAF3987178.1 unnamed protein product [Didymodactylos carnosus]
MWSLLLDFLWGPLCLKYVKDSVGYPQHSSKTEDETNLKIKARKRKKTDMKPTKQKTLSNPVVVNHLMGMHLTHTDSNASYKINKSCATTKGKNNDINGILTIDTGSGVTIMNERLDVPVYAIEKRILPPYHETYISVRPPLQFSSDSWETTTIAAPTRISVANCLVIVHNNSTSLKIANLTSIRQVIHKGQRVANLDPWYEQWTTSSTGILDPQ